MHWKHYWRNIIVRYHVLIEGWPDNIPFKNLSEVSSSLPALESLLRKLEAGKVYWKAISDGEFKDMEAARKAGLDDGTVVPPTPCHTRSDKGKKRSRYRRPNDGDGSDSNTESSSERPKKHTKKARHHRKAPNDENSTSSSESDAAGGGKVHGSQVEDDSGNAVSTPAAQGSVTAATHMADPGTIGSQVESVEN